MKDIRCFIQLGRFGDLILLLPAFKALFDRAGAKPIVVVSKEYETVLDGVSYVRRTAVDCHWWRGMAQARQVATEFFKIPVIIPQWWNSDKPAVPPEARGHHPVTCHGKNFFLNLSQCPNFMFSMWQQCGFTQEEMMRLPVVFDQRDAEREKALVKKARGQKKKPLLLVNWMGVSSPFAAMPEYMRVIHRFEERFNIVNLGLIKAERIYDLLGLYEAAAGLITIDTATLHLAGAGNIEYVAFTKSGWSGSVPKGKCVLEIKYDGAEGHAEKLMPILERWAGEPLKKPVVKVASGGGGILQV